MEPCFPGVEFDKKERKQLPKMENTPSLQPATADDLACKHPFFKFYSHCVWADDYAKGESIKFKLKLESCPSYLNEPIYDLTLALTQEHLRYKNSANNYKD